MSLQNLLSSIQEISEDKTAAIIQEAKKEAKRIIEEANQKAEKKKRQIQKRKEEELESKERADLAIEELTWKRKLLDAKASILDKIYTKAKDQITKTTKESKYQQFLEDATVEAILKIPGSDYLVRTNMRDSQVLKKKLKQIEMRIKKIKGGEAKITLSKDPIDSIGGILAYNKDMHEYYNNTLEARLLQSQSRLSGQLYKEIFGEK